MADTRLYEEVAGKIRRLIGGGTLPAGDKLPSVRELHRRWSVSISTVLEAYRLLEDAGVVEAKPRSGYFVRTVCAAQILGPPTVQPPRRPQQPRAKMIMRMHAEMNEPGVVRLGAATPDIDLLPTSILAREFSRAARRKPRAAHVYQTVAGFEPLRREVARRMVNAGCALDADDIVITSGAQQAVFLALSTVVKPGDVVATESPTYYGFIEILEMLGARVLELKTDPRTGLDLNALEEAAAKGRIKALALSTQFSNPLGSTMPEEKKKALLGLLNRHDLPLVEDDVYGELAFDGHRPSAVKAFDDSGLVIHCGSLSKIVSPGSRIGWAIPGRYRQEFVWNKARSSIATASLPQLVMADFLSDGGLNRLLRRLRRVYRDSQARVLEAIERYFPAGTRASRPTGGQLLWLVMPVGMDAARLYEELKPHRISIAPGGLFSTTDKYTNCIRLNLAMAYSDTVDRALRTVGRLARAQLD